MTSVRAAADRAPDPVVAQFTSVTKRFASGTVAVADLDLACRRGEFVSVVGPSGCGKTTLLRMIAGLTTPTAGSIAVEAGEIGYVFQDPNLLPWRSVAANVALGAELRHLPRADRTRRVEDALDLVGLSDVAGQLPRTLSGGMRMRVSLARCLLLDPDLCLFDEPFGALDELTRERLNDELLALRHVRPFTGIFVTHSVAEAVFLSTRVIVLSPRPGRIIADIDVPFAQPRTRDLRYSAPFTALVGRISDALREAPD